MIISKQKWTLAAEAVRANQLTRLPCLVVRLKFRTVCTAASKIGSQLLLASTSSNLLRGLGSEKVFAECLGVSSVFSSATYVQIWLLGEFDLDPSLIYIPLVQLGLDDHSFKALQGPSRRKVSFSVRVVQIGTGFARLLLPFLPSIQ